MTATDDLFQLIKSLTRGQKRSFKLYSSLYEGNKIYLKLFYAIDKQQQYDEEAIKKKFHREKFIKQLTRMKGYLYQLILRVMQRSCSDDSVTGQLQEMYCNIRFLFNNGLHKQCKKIITKAKHLAEKYEHYWFLMELYKWEISISRAEGYRQKNNSEIKTLYQKIFTTVDHYKNNAAYDDIAFQLIVDHLKEGYPHSNADIMKYQQIMQNPLLQANEEPFTYHSKSSFYRCHMFYNFIQNDCRQAAIYAKKFIALIESHPHFMEEYPAKYIFALHALIVYNESTKEHKENLQLIQKLKNIPPHLIKKSEYLKNVLYETIINVELSHCISCGKFNRGIAIVEEMEIKLKQGEFKITNKEKETDIYYLIAYTYFGAEQYNIANKYLQKVLLDTISTLYSDHYYFARILNLIIQFELGKKDLLEYTVKATYRYLYKQKRLFQLENSILTFIRKKLPHINSPKEFQTAFKELKIELEEIFKNPFESKVIECFDFISWIESKIENKPFAEIVRGKAEKGL